MCGLSGGREWSGAYTLGCAQPGKGHIAKAGRNVFEHVAARDAVFPVVHYSYSFHAQGHIRPSGVGLSFDIAKLRARQERLA